MSMRRTPSSGVGHDYSQGFGPATGTPGRGFGNPGPYQRAPRPLGSQAGVPVGFAGAVRRFYARYAQFSGRASRSEYWWVALYTAGVAVVLSILSSVVGTSPTGETNALGLLLSLLMFAFGLVNLLPGIAVTVRRLHDVDLSGWFYLLGLVPLIGGLVLLVLLVLAPKPGGARFDR
ncbi:DUF805 domain-containing protein [Kocuria sp. M1R5S2]|uniref:DUF805 domain-containing protein n=1 Tax=Kocuria rhizosphaerae TaxID=3376285 RepID=UPI0037972690